MRDPKIDEAFEKLPWTRGKIRDATPTMIEEWIVKQTEEVGIALRKRGGPSHRLQLWVEEMRIIYDDA